MNLTVRKILFVLIAIVSTLSFYACGRTNMPPPAATPSLIEGNWNETQETDSIIRSDGSLLYDSTILLSNTDFWNFKENGTCSLRSTIGFGPGSNANVFELRRDTTTLTGKYQLTDDRLVVTHTDSTQSTITVEYLTKNQMILYEKYKTSDELYTFVFHTYWEK